MAIRARLEIRAKAIARVFATKFQNVFNFVPSEESDLKLVEDEIDVRVKTRPKSQKKNDQLISLKS